jgi:hypothetical protein
MNTETKKKIINVREDMQLAEELFACFMLEVTINPSLQSVMAGCLDEDESQFERFRRTFLTALAWMHLQEQMMDAEKKGEKPEIV